MFFLAQSSYLNFIGTAESHAHYHSSTPDIFKESLRQSLQLRLCYFHLTFTGYCSLEPQQFVDLSHSLFVSDFPTNKSCKHLQSESLLQLA